MGESAKAEVSVYSPELESFSVETPGGRIHIRWDNRATKHAGQATLYLTTMHAARTALMLLIANIRAALSHVRKVAEQSPSTDRWKTLLDYIVARIIPHRPQKLLKTCALLASDCGF